MIIRFQCPSCRQPLEIDQQWAGQSVACPYCKRVVAAPTTSTWEPLAEVPTAQPAAPGFAPPPPPMGVTTVAPVRPGHRSVWAIVLALIAVGTTFLGMLIWAATLQLKITEQLGNDATPEEVQQAVSDIVSKGEAPRSPKAIAAVSIGMICGITALVLAISALVRQERGRGKAIVACILSATLLLCQMGLLLVFMAGRGVA